MPNSLRQKSQHCMCLRLWKIQDPPSNWTKIIDTHHILKVFVDHNTIGEASSDKSDPTSFVYMTKFPEFRPVK